MENGAEDSQMRDQPDHQETGQIEQGQVQNQTAAESPSPWKQNRAIGIIAALLVVIAAVFMIQWSQTQSQRGTPLHFLCESTGRTFTVYAGPDNDEYVEHYVGSTAGTPMPCRFDDNEDAYLARQNEDGQWIKQVAESEE